MKLDEITSEMLARAMGIYLRHAYRHRPPPPSVCELAAVDTAAPLAVALDRDGVGKAVAPDRPDVVQRYRWRLGNDRYPHMKLGIDRCSDADDFVFVADTHDRHFPLGSPVLSDPEFQKLLGYNEHLKHDIEADWTTDGLPTLQRRLARHLRECPGAGRPSGKTVLIVDDDDSILELERALVEDAGYCVLTASDGREAEAQMAGARPIDLCLLDIMMPLADGVTVAREARRNGARFPILYVTALPPDHSRDGIADGYVGKPFDPDYLLATIRRCIG
jgi:CheY-like chemotaxis protein